MTTGGAELVLIVFDAAHTEPFFREDAGGGDSPAPPPPPRPKPPGRRCLLVPPGLPAASLTLVGALAGIYGAQVLASAGATTIGPCALLAMQAQYLPAILYGRQPWRLLTAVLLHASLPHALGNLLPGLAMCALLEGLAGAARTLGTFAAAGLVGSLATAIAGPDGGRAISCGASAALLGVLAAAVAQLARDRDAPRRDWKLAGGGAFLAGMLLFDVLDACGVAYSPVAVSEPGASNYVAHTAGACAGALIGLGPRGWTTLGAWAAVLVAVLAAAVRTDAPLVPLDCAPL